MVVALVMAVSSMEAGNKASVLGVNCEDQKLEHSPACAACTLETVRDAE